MHTISKTEQQFFSLPELILRLHRTYQPMAEERRRRLVIKTEHKTPFGIVGDLLQIENYCKCIILGILEFAAFGRIDIEVVYKSDELMIVIKDNEQGTEFTAKFKVKHNESPKETAEEMMVLAWLMKDIEISDLVEEVMKSLPERLGVMLDQVASDNINDLKETVHGLKGVAGNFGMTELYALLVDLDRELKEQGKLTEHFIQSFSAFEQIIKSIPKTYLY